LLFTVHDESPKDDTQYIYNTLRFIISSSS